MPPAPERTPLADLLAERIRKEGPLSFAQYMEACLYDPAHGYYSKSRQEPRRDYVTSVDVGPLFARLLVRQFHDMWNHLGRPGAFQLVECGAGLGTLAGDILDAIAQSFPELYEATRYVAVERSASRRASHATSLEGHARNGRFRSSLELPEEIAVGCVFSNELFDAMPVHPVILRKNELREIYVSLNNHGAFSETEGPPSSPRIAAYLAQQKIALHDGQQAEVCLDACDWIETVGRRLGRGFVLTIDYGHEARELYDEHHMRGTLLAYYHHHADENYFRAPGEQDLTAHVNFTALDLWGRRAGLVRTGLTSQTNFLLALARDSECADLLSPTENEQESSRARLQFKTLIHPEGMGEAFRVFIQHKGIERPHLVGLEPL